MSDIGVSHDEDVDEDEFYDVDNDDETLLLSSSSSPPPPLDGGNQPREASEASSASSNQLEKCGHWLLSIPRESVLVLQEQGEYRDFLRAFDRLGQAYCRRLRSAAGAAAASLLAEHAADDVVLRVLEFLDCTDLLPAARTCVRFRDLARQSATQRTHRLATARQWNHNVFCLLRAQEQMEEGDDIGTAAATATATTRGRRCRRRPHVPIPILGLEQRVIVTNAGDDEFNGIYYCTCVDGNGFVFTKPRTPHVRASLPRLSSGAWLRTAGRGGLLMDDEPPPLPFSAGNKEEPARPGQLLRCIVAKRFSNERILWYMSKEIETLDEAGAPQVSQVFSYWADLMVAVTGEAESSDLCRYPAQSSQLEQQGTTGWQSLHQQQEPPPIVELLP